MKHPKIGKWLSLTLSLLIIFLLVSCTTSIEQSDLIGKWTEENSGQIEGLPLRSIEFFENGQVIIADQYEGTYMILENGELQVILDEGTYSDPIKIRGNTLTITQDDGDSKSYVKN